MDVIAGLMGCLIPLSVGIFILFTFIISNIRQINQYERGVLFHMGKFRKELDPGWKFIIPVFQSLRIVDVRIKTVDLQNQETMT